MSVGKLGKASLKILKIAHATLLERKIMNTESNHECIVRIMLSKICLNIKNNY